MSPVAWLLAAGAFMQAGWLLLWAVSGAARVSATITNTWSVEPRSILDLMLDSIAWVGALFPEIGPLPNLSVAGSLGVALAIVGLGYLAGVISLDRGVAQRPGAGRIVVGCTLLFQLTLLLIPGVFSTDVYSYLIYGQIAGVHGLNPYIVAPDVLVGNPLLEWIYPDWQSLPSPYGPLWTALSAAAAPRLVALDIADQVLVHKLFMNLVHLVNLGLIAWLLARSLPDTRGARLTAFAVFAWNPLLLLEIAGNGHNDGLMLTLLLAGLVPIAGLSSARRRQWRGNAAWVVGTLFVALSMLVKYATLLVGIVSMVVWARELRDRRARVLWVGGSLVAVAGLGLALYWPWLAGVQILSPAFDEINGKFQFHSLPALIQRLIGDWLPSVTELEPDVAANTAQFWVYALCHAFFVIYLTWELKRVWASDELRPAIQVITTVSARALLVALLLVLTEVHSWYFTWPLALVTLLGWRTNLTRLVVGYTLTSLPVDYIALFDWNATVPIPARVVLGAAYLGLPLIVPAALYARRVWVAVLHSRRALALADFL